MRYVKVGSGAYQLVEDATIQTIIQGHDVEDDLYHLREDGSLTIRRFFAWDGPSGAANTRDFIMGSCVHDALCEMIRKGLLPENEQSRADLQMDIINRTPQVWSDGESMREIIMAPIRRIYSYIAVRVYQYLNTDRHHRQKIYEINYKEA